MPDLETTSSQPAPLFAPRAAVWLGVAVLIGFAAVLGFTLRDAGREGALERFDQVTALGDTNYYVVPSPPPIPPPAIVQWEGKAWAPVDFTKHDIRDTQAVRVGRDEVSGLAIYRRREGAKDGELFVKRDTDSFFLLRPIK